MDRRDTILAMFDASGFGLEIGPSYNPLLPKSAGHRVETIDYADQETLRRKYADNRTVDIARIEPVDFVSDGRAMSEVIGAEARYDFILASHVIEHTPDMIGFLKDCERLLKPAGVLVLAVPDKRCCFDVFQRLTSTGEVIDAHRAGRSRPGFGSIFDEVAYGVRQDGATGWPKGTTGDRRMASDVRSAVAVARDAATRGHYVDVHVWRFVPSSFELILGDLFEAGEIALRLVSLRSTDEMLVVLSREGRGSERPRTELLQAVLEEQAYEQVLAADRAREAIEAERDALGAEREALAAECAALRQSLDRLDAGATREEIDALRHSEARAAEHIAALHGSTSWRLTRPLRAVKSRLRPPRPRGD